MVIYTWKTSCAIIWILIARASASLSPNFRDWLSIHYPKFDFDRKDLGGLSFGGKTDAQDTVVNQPVIFVHGVTGSATKIVPIRDYFLTRGYKNSELYATTWGIPDGNLFMKNSHTENHVMYVRTFIEAVINYTNAGKIDIIGHSMGVTLSRKAIKGGMAWNEETVSRYNVGKPLSEYVDTFVGIAGPNYGFNSCTGPKEINEPFCNRLNGFYPGIMVGTEVVNKSAFLEDLNSDGGYEGSHRYSLYTIHDRAFGNEGKVYCQQTEIFPETTRDFKFDSSIYGHVTVRDLTAPLQHDLVKFHNGTVSSSVNQRPCLNLIATLLSFFFIFRMVII